MKKNKVVALLIAATFCCVLVISAQAQKKNQDSQKRAKPPKWDKRTANLFFEDLFKEGLIGSRPENLGTPVATVSSTGPNGNAPVAEQGVIFAWSKLISATTIEDEVKSIKLQVDKQVTTPGKFRSGVYQDVRTSFSVLAMLLAIAAEYDDEVRWKKDAPAARDLFSRSAANTKVGSIQAYNESKVRKADLQDLLGGGGLQLKETERQSDWSKVCDRAPLMKRLEIGHDEKLSKWTASESEFSQNLEAIFHEAEMIAAVSEVLMKEGMEEADDDDYIVFAKQMREGALEVVSAVKIKNADQARKAAGEISKSCSGCHETYR